MKYKRIICCAILLLLLVPTAVSADGAIIPPDRSLNIATTDNRPLSVDRLVYLGCKHAGYRAVFSCPSVREGYISANDGAKDGVIVSHPAILDMYPNLRKVPVALEHINVRVFAREGSGLSIQSWDELAGMSVGILTGRVYINEKLPADTSRITRETDQAVLDGLLEGEYDVALLAERSSETLSPKTGIDCVGQVDTLTEYLYLNKKHEGLIPLLTEALSGVFEDGSADKILHDEAIPEISAKSTVVHIFSSNRELSREDQFNAVLRGRFERDTSVEWYEVSLNSKRFSRDPGRLIHIAELLRQDCVSRNVAAIVVSGEDALEFLTNYYYLYFRGVPVLFYGVGEDYQAIVKGYEGYFTGVVESLGAYDTLAAALALFPGTRSVHVINDYSTEGLRYRSAMHAQLEPLRGGVQIEYNENMDCDALIDYLSALPDDSMVFFGSYFVDASGQYYALSEMRSKLKEKCKAPIISLYSTDLPYGSIGGKCLDYARYAGTIAGMLQRLLGGGSVAELPVITDSRAYSRWVFDKIELDEFGINESALPEGARLINKAPSIWESDPRFAITMLILLAVSVAVVIGASVLFVNQRKRKAQREIDEQVREVKERLERIIHTAPISFMLAIDHKVVEINDIMSGDTGLKVGDSAQVILESPERLEEIYATVAREQVLTNVILKIKLQGGETRRCLTNIAAVKYDHRMALAVWAVDIEERERHKDELAALYRETRDVKERLEWIVQNSSVGYMLVIGGAVAEVNEDGRRAMGLKVGDVVAQTLNKIDRFDEIMEMLRERREVRNEVVELTYVNGEKHRSLVSAASFRYNELPATVVWVVDIEQSEAQKDQLQTAQQNLQMLLDMLPVAVRVMDIETRTIRYANKAAARMFGVPEPSEAIGMSYARFLPETQPDGRGSMEMIGRVKLTAEPVNIEIVMRRVNGELFDSLVTSCLFDYNGRLSSLGIMQDLSSEKEYQRMLASTAEKEKEANQLKSRFLVNMSHEIRTPMNAIIGLTEIELHKDFPSEPKEIYNKINISAKNLLSIINDILDLSKIEADKIELFEEEFELEEVLNSALLVTAPRLDDKNVEFLLNGAVNLPRYVVGDRTRLWQILKNFLDNSAKFTDRGKIVLTVFADLEHSDDETVTITFIVEDTGIGMDEGQIERMFLPYEQVYSDAQRRYSGTGLGLSISKQLCELMGGALSVESRLGSGTTVRVSIPFRRSQKSEAQHWLTKAPALSGINALIVDDDRLSLEIMERLLKNSDVNCTTARSGVEAMDIIIERRGSDQAFDVILLDYMMDGLNGLETARQIQLLLSEAPKLLMVTAYQKMLMKDEFDSSGVDGVIEKPFVPSQFMKKLCAILGFEPETEVESPKIFPRYTGVNVLLCEDYRLNQEVAVGMLAHFGIQAAVAENGREGLDMLAGDRQFDLVFMDLQMPIMDGLAATRAIKADPRLASVPVIGLTADAMKEVIEECRLVGMSDHLAKPISFDSLYKMLRKWLPDSKRVKGEVIQGPPADPLNQALAYFEGDREQYQDALLEFAQLLPDEWPDFARALADMENTGRFIHKLRGASGTLSEREIYKCASDFGASVRAGQPDAAAYERLVRVCNAVKKRIGWQAKKSDAAALEAGTAAELAGLLAALQAALRAYDPEAINPVVKQLKGKAWPGADEALLLRLYGLVRQFDYAAALDAVGALMGEG